MASRPRITGGRLKGRALATGVPAGARPTSSRVREAVFSMVGHDLEGLRVLDAFGGSGLLGLEACSRGADVCIVEQDGRAVKAIRQNAAELGVAVEVLRGDVTRLAAKLGPFDGVLADPPYALDPGPILAALEPVVQGWLILETDARTEAPERVGRLARQRRRHYGGTSIHLYEAEV